MTLCKRLIEYSKENNISFHMPGHKNGIGFDSEFNTCVKFDQTEILGLDNLHYPEGIIKESLDKLSSAYSSIKSYFLVNGSTCGIFSAIFYSVSKGDKIIINRDCHISVINAITLVGAQPIFVTPEFSDKFLIPTYIHSNKLEEALLKNSDAKAILITRPSYYGVCCDIIEIKEIANKYNMILIVDEAHGAHLGSNESFPPSSAKLNCDIVIQSAHKTLPALTQGGYLHIGNSEIDLFRIEKYLRIFQTTSPSYLIMASLDYSRHIYEHKSKNLLDILYSNIINFIIKIKSNTKFEVFNISNTSGVKQDMSKILLCLRSISISGFETQKILYTRFNIQIEMADNNNILIYTSLFNTNSDFDKLYNALFAIYTQYKSTAIATPLSIPNIFNLQEKIFSMSEVENYPKEKISIYNAENRICYEQIIPYPPGIPILFPGEKVNNLILKYIIEIHENNGKINGIDSNGCIWVISN